MNPFSFKISSPTPRLPRPLPICSVTRPSASKTRKSNSFLHVSFYQPVVFLLKRTPGREPKSLFFFGTFWLRPGEPSPGPAADDAQPLPIGGAESLDFNGAVVGWGAVGGGSSQYKETWKDLLPLQRSLVFTRESEGLEVKASLEVGFNGPWAVFWGLLLSSKRVRDKAKFY